MRDPRYANLMAAMRIDPAPRAGILTAGLLAALCAYAQAPAPPKAEGIPPRAAPTDYQAHAKAGDLTVAAESTGHSVATPESTLTSEDYVVIETAIYGPPGAHAKIAAEDFSLRVNAKKPVTAQPYGLVVKTLKDPELEPTAAESKSKTSVGTGGQSDSDSKPPPYRVPDALRHEWSLRLQKLSLPEGDRPLPQAGLIYFIYRGRTEKIQSMELTYTGPAGPVTLALQP